MVHEANRLNSVVVIANTMKSCIKGLDKFVKEGRDGKYDGRSGIEI